MGLFDYNDVGIDLGTASVLVYVKGKGIVMREPSVVAVDRNNGRDAGYRRRGAELCWAEPPATSLPCGPCGMALFPTFHDTERMLRYFLPQGHRAGSCFFKPRVIVCVPSGVTEVEKRSVIEATEEAGARHTCLIEEPIAAAIGAGLDIGEASRQHGAGYWRRHDRRGCHLPGRFRHQRFHQVRWR